MTCVRKPQSARCCSQKPTNDREHGACCGHGQSPQPGSAHSRRRWAVRGSQPFELIHCRDQNKERTQNSENGDDQPSVSATAPTLSTSCNCVRSSEPLDAPVQRAPLSELRDILSLNNALCGVVDSVDKPTHAWSHDSTQPTITPHFSQITLCVWRL